MRTNKVTVTPTLAAEWLKRNALNRPLSADHVRDLAREMAQGNWVLTHHALAFDRNGVLLDGQHRLAAVVASGVTVDVLVTLDCERDTFPVLDSGRKRTNADVLAMRGVPNARACAAIARSALIGVAQVGEWPTRSAVDRFVMAHEDVIQALVPVAKAYAAPVGAAFCNAKLARMRGILEAGTRLVELEFLGDDDPMKQLAKRLRELKGKGPQTSKYAVTVTALRAVHEGRALKFVRHSKANLDVDHSEFLTAGV